MLKELDKPILDDFEHQVTRKMQQFEQDAAFPKLEDYGLSREKLDDYLFDKQAILDMGGSPRTQLTIAGVLIVLPVLILSAFPEESYPFGSYTLFAAIALGILLALFAKSLLKMIIQVRLRKLADPKVDGFIHAVLRYKQ
ncbi:hypothetical protein [Prevotella sp. AGR2160]|uniref:hypothetical protein n=1 Tax=Prevotella sp. AGR2160 TaxID=1280674 RepID=UPI0003FA5C05|nr:hypothetical protein [Prevotella sp. AGR2160]